ncbi:MAG: mannose-1-phosphate guanylyltransferase/mannose-6-phosphate isomerase [Rhodospirillales bacterium]|jgi:mannose-1-phosphate guanylyltransferase / mannose-6-phosphate isomerase|nr:mannose-1-phosphate guanylyltransferase/mannose-6-phosphate isomerase [Rhodospirillales bacterium]
MTEAESQAVIHPVILSGGLGKHLWPVSRAMYPKQFQRYGTDHTLLQETALRVNNASFAPPLIISNEDHRFIVAEQLNSIGINPAGIILEPESRNTAPAIIIAAIKQFEVAPSSLMLVMPSDHNIPDPQTFTKAIRAEAKTAQAGKIVCFSIKPTSPNSTYGYMKTINQKSINIESFIEKPDQETAKSLIDKGYQWNSGIYLLSPKTLLNEIINLAPDLHDQCKNAYENKVNDLDFIRLDTKAFTAIVPASFDKLIMENTTNAAMLPLNTGWQDVQTWESLLHSETGKKANDKDGNILDGDVIALDTSNSLIRSEGILTATIGIDNLAIIVNDDAILISDINRVNEVDKFIELIDDHGGEQHLHHRTVYRPWGSFTSILAAPGFQVKELTVKPGAILSLQKHFHRAEHWVVVEGTAEVTRDNDIFLLHENQSTYIPLGTIHRLCNPGKIPLRVIEVQSGSYLGEDDIVRIDDTYGRQ